MFDAGSWSACPAPVSVVPPEGHMVAWERSGDLYRLKLYDARTAHLTPAQRPKSLFFNADSLDCAQYAVDHMDHG